MSSEDWKTVAAYLAQSTDMSWRQIAKHVNIPKSTVSDFLRERGTVKRGPKIGILDIETAPTLAWVWRRWKENIHPDQVESETTILSAAVKELGRSDVQFTASWQYGAVEDDRPVVEWLHQELCNYDILIAHNGDKFDFPIINTRMAYHGLVPPAPYRTVDTLKLLKKRFRFPSNRLDAVAQYLGLGSKVDHDGFKLWKGVMHGDKECMDLMETYNIHDVVLLEELYLHIRAWEHGHPSVASRSDSEQMICNVCGSSDMHPKDEQYHYTSVSKFQLHQCHNCGHWQRDRMNLHDKATRDILGVSVK